VRPESPRLMGKTMKLLQVMSAVMVVRTWSLECWVVCEGVPADDGEKQLVIAVISTRWASRTTLPYALFLLFPPSHYNLLPPSFSRDGWYPRSRALITIFNILPLNATISHNHLPSLSAQTATHAHLFQAIYLMPASK